MCVIAICPKNVRPSLETLKACWKANPHGGGIAWRSGDAIRWHKSNSLEEIHQLAEAKQGTIVIHFRIATVGGVCDELRHPFPVTACAQLAEEGRAKAVLFQNGTWHSWQQAVSDARAEGFELPEGKWSDARAAAWLVSIRGPRILDTLTPSRWVHFTAEECKRFGDWTKRDGVYFSNMNWTKHLPTPKPAPLTASQRREVEAQLDAENRELWDMSTVPNYWEKVNARRLSRERGNKNA